MTLLIEELENIINEQKHIDCRAYYKIVKGIKVYYDFQLLEENPLTGSYQLLNCLELLYYLEEQKNFAKLDYS